MKNNTSFTSSSTKSSTTTAISMEDSRSENRDSCYFPGCRKDTNCNCEICLASITATLDLMPMSIQKSSMSKLSASESTGERTPISFNPSVLSTPKSSIYQTRASPVLRSTAKSMPPLEKMEKDKKNNETRASGFDIWRILVCVCLIFAADSGFSWMVTELLQPTLSIETVRNIAKQSLDSKDLNDKLGFLQKKLGDTVKGRVFSCSSNDSTWEMNQKGMLLNSRCTLYKSMAEEVSIWGWPLQTAGLLATGFSSRSLTVLSGRVTEWPEGKIGFSIHNANDSSWQLRRMSAAAVQFDPNTWVLEYRWSAIVENSRLFSTVIELFKHRISRVFWEMKQQFLLLPSFDQLYTDPSIDNFICPT